MGIVFQSPTLDTDLTVRQNMLYYAALHGISGRQAADRHRSGAGPAWHARTHLAKSQTLNGGHRRRMEIARALIHNPKVLLLDEPTAGLDMAMRKSITAHVHDLAQNDGSSVCGPRIWPMKLPQAMMWRCCIRASLWPAAMAEDLPRAEPITVLFHSAYQRTEEAA